MSRDDFYLYEGDNRPGGGRYLVPVWLHHLLTVLAIVLWIMFAAWADLGAVVAALGVFALLWLRKIDYLGF